QLTGRHIQRLHTGTSGRSERRRLTSRCSSVKITGSATNTRLDSLVIEAERMWELTVRERLRRLGFLYNTNTSLATPAMRHN
uniref:Uncharacterized protein n=1 Tax=Cynoglossus semilaevis TaxID=244447 RepID=A0A3P8VUF3_CYNSE